MNVRNELSRGKVTAAFFFMSRSEKYGQLTLLVLALAAFFGILAVVYGLVLETYGERRELHTKYQDQAKTQQKIAADHMADACFGIVGPAFVKCVSDQMERYEANRPADADLRAQQDMALWALWMFIASCSTVLVTGVGIYYVRETLEASRSAVRAADDAVAETRRIGEAQVRAYLSIESVSIAVDPDAGNIKLSMDINNAGQSPARKAEIILEFVFAGLMRLPDKATTRLLVRLIPANTLYHQQEIGLQDINIPQGYSDENYKRMAVSLTAVVFANDVFDKEIAAVFSGSRVHSDDAPWLAMAEMFDTTAIGGTIISEHGLDIYRRQRFWGDQTQQG